MPFYTDTGRLNACARYPVNWVWRKHRSHQEGPEATPYLPVIIVSASRFVRAGRLWHPADAMGWEERTVRNLAMSWNLAKLT